MMERTEDKYVVWILHDGQRRRKRTTAALVNGAGLPFAQAFEKASALLDALTGPSAPPDVVLLDLHLPERSGLDVLPKIRAAAPETAVVVLAPSEEEGLVFEAFKAGASGFLARAAASEDVRAAMRQTAQGGVLMPRSVAGRVLNFFREETEVGADRYGLTGRERQVLKRMAQGLTQRKIAKRLFVSPHTVNSHVQHIYAKLHVHSGIEAVAKAVRERLV